MLKSTQDAIRKLDEACRLKLECRYGAEVYRFKSYDIRGGTIFIDITDKANRAQTVERSADVLPAFMDRAMIGKVEDSDGIIKLSDLKPYVKRKRGVAKSIHKNIATVWFDKGVPARIVFSQELSLELGLVNPGRVYSPNFYKDMIIFIMNTREGVKASPRTKDRIGVSCTGFSREVKFRRYKAQIKEIEDRMCVVLSGIK